MCNNEIMATLRVMNSLTLLYFIIRNDTACICKNKLINQYVIEIEPTATFHERNATAICDAIAQK